MGDAASRGWGPGWNNCQADKQTTITLEGSDAAFPVRREIAELVQVLCETTIQRGYPIRKADTWGYNCRPISGTNTPSNHSWGLAVDINWQTNPHRSPLTTDMPGWMPTMWEDCGFNWGGRWSKPDAMHYEYMGTPATVPAHLNIARTYTTPPPTPRKARRMWQLWQETEAGHLFVSDGINVRWLTSKWDADNITTQLKAAGLPTTTTKVNRQSIRNGELGVYTGPRPPW